MTLPPGRPMAAGPTSRLPPRHRPAGGKLEIRIPFHIFSQGEAPPADLPECINDIPFRMASDGSRTIIEGEGPIDWHFVDTPQGSPITFHVILEFNGNLDGELLPATPEKPSGWLDAYLVARQKRHGDGVEGQRPQQPFSWLPLPR